MKNIPVMVVLLLTCQLCMMAIAGRMTDITAHNYFSTTRSGGPLNPPTISYVTNGKPLQGWVFTQSTGSTDIMSVSTDNGNSYYNTPGAGGSGTYEGNGNPIVFNQNPGTNKPVVIKMRSTNFGIDNTFYNNSAFTDGWIRVKTLSFPGYVNGTKNIGDGVWLGWGDNVINLPKNDPTYQWDDLVFILQGVIPVASDSYGDTVTLKLPPVIIGNRLFVTSWREENK